MLKILVFLTGAWIYRLISGKKSDEVQLTDWQPLLITMSFLVWILSLLYCVVGIGNDVENIWIPIVFAIGIPALFVTWGIFARRKK